MWADSTESLWISQGVHGESMDFSRSPQGVYGFLKESMAVHRESVYF
jgi:hypothetical protein